MAPDPTRRRLLSLAGLAGASLVLGRSGWADDMPPSSRALSFLNTHTGERVSLTYWADGRYVPEAVAAMDRVLRDHRTGDVIEVNRHLLDVLHAIRSDLGTTAPFHVISCYRSPKTNAALRAGGHAVAEHSLHMEGKAMDVRLAGVSCAKLRDVALSMSCGGVGYYARSNFVHLDTGRVRAWAG